MGRRVAPCAMVIQNYFEKINRGNSLLHDVWSGDSYTRGNGISNDENRLV